MMNAAIVSNINGGVSNQQVASGSHSSLFTPIEFSLTEVKTNFKPPPNYQGKYLIKLTGKEEIFNGQNKTKNCDQYKKSIENSYLSINGNKEKSDEDSIPNPKVALHPGRIHVENSSEDIIPIPKALYPDKIHLEKSVQNSIPISKAQLYPTKIHVEKSEDSIPISKAQLYTGKIHVEKSEDSIPVPKVQLYTGKIYVEWNQVYKIGAGLNNLGNTCFMNTVIQCLTYCPPLANYLLHDNDHSEKCPAKSGNFCMMCLLQRHMKKAIGKTGEVIKPLDVYQRLKVIAKHFQFGRQEDAHEFLRYVIDHLWKSCLPQANGVAKLDPASKETTVINKIFGGYHRSQVICLRCKKESNTFDHFMDFILDIKNNVSSLEKALEKFTQPELLQQDNCYKCPKCKMKVEAQKRFSVFRPPTVATFQLKRFDYNRSFGGKITKQVFYPEKLNLRPYMSETKGDPVMYRLNAVLVHSGPTCNSGHYFCYVKNSNGLWYIMDDQRVHQVSLNQVLSQSAYVLFYIKMESSERSTFKKCLENKNTVMKGTIPNSQLLDSPKFKSVPLGEKNAYIPSKLHSSPNSMKKLVSNQNREKISFSFQTNGSSTSLASSKSKTGSLEPLSTTHCGLVPYVEDSSESSDASENGIESAGNHPKHHTKNGSLGAHRSSPQSESKAKLSKSVLGSSSPVPKVSATGSWIVTDAPHTTVSSSSCSSGVTSTTDWQVIEASDLKQNNSFQFNSGRDYSSAKKSLPETITSKHFASNGDQGDLSNSTKKSAWYENSPSAQKCNFRKQIHKSKAHFTEDEETDNNYFKRKSSDSYSKASKDSPYSEHSESRHSPLFKKAKYAENASMLSLENGVRNSHVDNSLVQRQYSVSHCDNSRTSLVNGLSSPVEGSSSKNSVILNGSSEKDKKFSVFSKGKQDNSFSDSKPLQYGKEKLSVSHSGKNTSLYGTEIPTWREENHYRPSVISSHGNRRTFDEYDHEFDRGKVRKSKMKDHYQYFNQKNPFQKHADKYGKYHNKFFSNHHNHRKYDSRHNWKTNHSYDRYRNHHRRY